LRLALASVEAGASKLRLALASVKAGASELRLALTSVKVGASELRLALALVKAGASELRLALTSIEAGASGLCLALASIEAGASEFRFSLVSTATGASESRLKYFGVILALLKQHIYVHGCICCKRQFFNVLYALLDFVRLKHFYWSSQSFREGGAQGSILWTLFSAIFTTVHNLGMKIYLTNLSDKLEFCKIDPRFCSRWENKPGRSGSSHLFTVWLFFRVGSWGGHCKKKLILTLE
jgi:hypothetical protein